MASICVLWIVNVQATLHDAVETIRRNETLTPFRSVTLQSTDDRGASLLHYAVSYQRYALARYLLKTCELSPNHRNEDGHTPLHVALRNSDGKMTDILLEHNACAQLTDGSGDLPPHYLIQENKLALLRKIITHDASCVNAQRINPDDGRFEFLLQRAITCNNKEATSLLLSYRVDCNLLLDATHRTFFHYALEWGRDTIAEMLYPHGTVTQEDGDGYLPIHKAAQSGSIRTLRRILYDYPQLITCRSRIEGNTPLHEAYDAHTVDTLIDHNAQLTPSNQAGHTPFHLAFDTYLSTEHADTDDQRRHDMRLCALVRRGALSSSYDCKAIYARYQRGGEQDTMVERSTSALTLARRNTMRMLVSCACLTQWCTPALRGTSLDTPYYASLYFPCEPENTDTEMDPCVYEKQRTLILHGMQLTSSPAYVMTRFSNHTTHAPRVKRHALNAHDIPIVRAISSYEQMNTLAKFQKLGYFSDINASVSK